MSFHVKRTRTQDNTEEHLVFGRPSMVGRVGYSRTFPTRPGAEREAASWRSSGDFSADVIEGKAPRTADA